MQEQIFRQAALDRLASPEGLDRPGRLVSASGWLPLALFMAALCGAGIWAIFADAPVKVIALGIVLPEGGLLEIVAGTSGRIEVLSLEPGQRVAQDETVAIFARLDLRRDLANASSELADAEARLNELTDFYLQSDRRQTEAEDLRLATIKQTQSFVERRRGLLEEKIKSLEALIKQQIIVRDQLTDAELDLASAQERLFQLDDEMKVLSLRRLERESEHRLALLNEQLRVEQLKRQVRRLEAQLADDQTARSAHSGRVIEVRVTRGDYVVPGTPLATVAPDDLDASESGILGLLYVPPADGKRIQTGMRAEIAPSTVKREEYGYMLAEVVQISRAPATVQGMQSVLKNEQLVRRFSEGGAPFEVRVRFLTDQATPSGFAWSSATGPDTQILPGTLLEGRIVVDRIPLVDLVVPGASASLRPGDG